MTNNQNQQFNTASLVSVIKTGIMVFLILVPVFVLSRHIISKQLQNKPFCVLTVEQVKAMYADDSHRADLLLENKDVAIIGRAVAVHSFSGRVAFLLLRSNDLRDEFTIECIFHPMHIDKLQRLSLGQVVRVRGRFQGKILGVVSMDRCYLE